MKSTNRAFLFCLSFFSCCLINAQNNSETNRKIFDQATGDLLYSFQYTDIKGSPFLFDNWMKGELILENDSRIKDVQLKFDSYGSKFIINKNDTAYQISPAIKEIRLYPTGDTSNAMVFKNGFSINGNIQPNTYLQVLAGGKTTLLKYSKKDMEEYTEYGDATKYKRFTERNQYFIYSNNSYKATTLSKKNLQDLLSDKWNEVSQYMNQHSLSGKDEKSWKQAIEYYNTL